MEKQRSRDLKHLDHITRQAHGAVAMRTYLLAPLSGAVALHFITTRLLPSCPPRTRRLCASQLPARGIAVTQGRVVPGSSASQGGRGLLGAPIEPLWLLQSGIFPQLPCRRVQTAIKILKPKGWNILSRNKETSLYLS